MKAKDIIFKDLPSEDLGTSPEMITEARSGQVLVVLDDDPTGTQSVHGLSIITDWKEDTLESAFQKNESCFYILTNSRSLEAKEAYELIYDISTAVKTVADNLEKDFIILTRGDSTLRGHFQHETQAVIDALSLPSAMIVFAPAFFDGGRYTIGNIHYVEDDGKLIEVAETPFAKDKTFGFDNSNLYEYILERSDLINAKDEIFDLSVEEIRSENTAQLLKKVIDNKDKKALIINAISKHDLDKVSLILLKARKSGVPLLFRSAASLVPSLVAMTPKPLLEKNALGIRSGAGLAVVGSYVPKTTSQLKYFLSNNELESIEIDVEALLEDQSRTVETLSQQLNDHLRNERDCVLFTSRFLIAGKSPEESLAIVNKVSEGVISIVKNLTVKPSFVLAKGGITSSDVATKAMNIREAKVLGQLIPGVPVWEMGPETRFEGVPYIVFPGNVGNEQSLSNAFRKLKHT